MRLFQALERLDPELSVEVLLARKHRPTSSAVPDHWPVSVALPPDYFYYMTPLRFWASLFVATWRVARAARRADVVHAVKDYPHNLVGVLGARLAGRPCVATAHGTYTVQPLMSRRHRRLARWVYGQVARMISVSHYTRGRLVELLGEDALGSVEVIPNRVDAGAYEGKRAVGDVPWRGKDYTLSIGELKERKGHHLALAAWLRVVAAHPELHHFVVGNLVGGEYEAGLRRSVEEALCTERVHFLGNVSEDEKVDLLQGARVFVHTPVTAADGGFEGFGLVYLEAAAAGTASLGTLHCGAEDAIVDGKTGLLVEPDEDAVAAGLKRLLDDPAGTRAMGEAGRAHAAASSWGENAARVHAIYQEVTGT
jgi:phosphatidylinositol alpha-1,6-mannosyltransferase